VIRRQNHPGSEEESTMLTKPTLIGLMTATVALTIPAGAASANPPDHLGPFIDTYSFTVDCGDFEATVDGTSSTRFIVHFDDDGNVTHAQQFVRAPYDVWVNTTTGASVVVRGEFQQTYTPIPDTDEITVAIRGFRYLVNEPGRGVIVQEVGRIVYGEPTEETILAIAGQHDTPHGSQVEPVLCAALR
jgi:hypothetical protein